MLALLITLGDIAGNTDVALRSFVDDFVRVLIRTQHVVNPAGNIFTGGLEEALFNLHIGKTTNSDNRVGSPAAGTPSIYLTFIQYLVVSLIYPSSSFRNVCCKLRMSVGVRNLR